MYLQEAKLNLTKLTLAVCCFWLFRFQSQLKNAFSGRAIFFYVVVTIVLVWLRLCSVETWFSFIEKKSGYTYCGSAADTIERLVSRMSSSTQLEDRRDACRALKAMSRKFRVEVGAQVSHRPFHSFLKEWRGLWVCLHFLRRSYIRLTFSAQFYGSVVNRFCNTLLRIFQLMKGSTLFVKKLLSCFGFCTIHSICPDISIFVQATWTYRGRLLSPAAGIVVTSLPSFSSSTWMFVCFFHSGK